jgi:phosphate transport system substrate-binding protein
VERLLDFGSRLRSTLRSKRTVVVERLVRRYIPRMRPLALLALLPLAACSKAPTSTAPHQIHVAGSSAGYLLSTEVAERLMREDPDVLAPLVRAGGTGEGIARFCDTDNPTRPDILITTRAMTADEKARCAADGSADIEQREIGTTAVVLVEAKGSNPLPGLNRIDVAKALISNAKTWADVRPGLPAIPILIHGPTPTPGIADTLYGPILQGGQQVRTDGAYTGHGADAGLVARIVAEKPGSVGVVPLAQAIADQDMLAIISPDLPALRSGEKPQRPFVNGGDYTSDMASTYTAALSLYLIDRPTDARRIAGLNHLVSYYRDALAKPRPELQGPAVIE